MTKAQPAQILASAAALLAMLNGVEPAPANAQGLANPETIDAIVGTPVKEQETEAAADPEKLLAAIDKTAENISSVRKTTTLDRLDIVFLADSSVTDGGPPDEIQSKLSERQEDIRTLRQEIEGNAMLYHALDSRQILIRDILAIEFEKNRIVIYAAAKPAS